MSGFGGLTKIGLETFGGPERCIAFDAFESLFESVVSEVRKEYQLEEMDIPLLAGKICLYNCSGPFNANV